MDLPIKILIVDDEPKNLTVLETVLDDPSYRLFRAESAEQALRALVAEEFALLILDIQMPDMTGFELAKLIKERKKTARVPIIFLTAHYNEDQHVLAAYDIGAVDYLYKPVNPTILRSKVNVFAELHRKGCEVEAANQELLSEVADRRRAEEQLRELNGSLEQRVAERTAALRNADQRKDEFLATLAHELRNPLAPVRNAVQFLNAKMPAIPELQWAKDVIDRQTQHLARLIDELMDVSRISRGKIELKREHITLSAVVEGAIETSRSLIDECGHKLTLQLPPQAVILNGDPTRLSQVFLNLLNNAAKYMERGGRIDLHAEQRNSAVVVTVKDTGIGIPADRLPTIFDMFSQVEGALCRSQGGLGIGLSLVKQVVELHGGCIEAHSDGPGTGSEFVVSLPIVVEQCSSGQVREADRALPKTDLRILVADDLPDTALSMALLLKMMGNKVRTAQDGEETVQVAAQFQPHVLLCDIGMPKMNGYQVARAIRSESWGKNMILVAVTGWGQDGDKRQAESAGFDHHMVKPLDQNVLIQLLTQWDAIKA